MYSRCNEKAGSTGIFMPLRIAGAAAVVCHHKATSRAVREYDQADTDCQRCGRGLLPKVLPIAVREYGLADTDHRCCGIGLLPKAPPRDVRYTTKPIQIAGAATKVCPKSAATSCTGIRPRCYGSPVLRQRSATPKRRHRLHGNTARCRYGLQALRQRLPPKAPPRAARGSLSRADR